MSWSGRNYVSAVAVLTIASGVAMSETYAADDMAGLHAEVDALKKQVQEAGEWRRSDSMVHLSGYGAVTYSDAQSENGAYDGVLFAPIFHYQYKDLMLLESELEVEVGKEGETEPALEYLALDLFLNDHVTLMAGKFLSPIGQFRQNLHPAWINKLPSEPPGFGHDGAAPAAEVGAGLRGGLPASGGRLNYAFYVGNGPELEAADGELEGVRSEGMTRDEDGKKVLGGRLGFQPIAKFEVGMSAATGQAAVARDAAGAVASDPARDYDVTGVDFSGQIYGLELRGEYVRQKAGAAAGSVAPDAAAWKAWYTHASYPFQPGKWEGVLRYTDFSMPDANQGQRQWAAGVNYLFAPSVIAKLAYEKNDGESGTAADADRIQVQLAYGF